MSTTRLIPPHVREAISVFLDRCQKEARPFATSEALGAIRTMFPELDTWDADLDNAISSQACTAGFDINFGAVDIPDRVRINSLERRDN